MAEPLTDDEETRLRRVAAGGSWLTDEELANRDDSPPVMTTRAFGSAGAAVEAKLARNNYAQLFVAIDALRARNVELVEAALAFMAAAPGDIHPELELKKAIDASVEVTVAGPTDEQVRIDIRMRFLTLFKDLDMNLTDVAAFFGHHRDGVACLLMLEDPSAPFTEGMTPKTAEALLAQMADSATRARAAADG